MSALRGFLIVVALLVCVGRAHGLTTVFTDNFSGDAVGDNAGADNLLRWTQEPLYGGGSGTLAAVFSGAGDNFLRINPANSAPSSLGLRSRSSFSAATQLGLVTEYRADALMEADGTGEAFLTFANAASPLTGYALSIDRAAGKLRINEFNGSTTPSATFEHTPGGFDFTAIHRYTLRATAVVNTLTDVDLKIEVLDSVAGLLFSHTFTSPVTLGTSQVLGLTSNGGKSAVFDNIELAISSKAVASFTADHAAIITGGAVDGSSADKLRMTVSDSAAVEDTLHYVFTAGANANVTVNSVTGAGTQHVAPGGSQTHTFSATSTVVGVHALTGGSIDAPFAAAPPSMPTLSLTVKQHAGPEFANVATPGDFDNTGPSLTIDLGQHTIGPGSVSSFFDVFATLTHANPALVAGLDLDAIIESDPAGVFSLLGLASFPNLAAGGSVGYQLDFDTSQLGVFSAKYSFLLSDEDLPGATSHALTVIVTAEVVPEPASVVLLIPGLFTLFRRRRTMGR